MRDSRTFIKLDDHIDENPKVVSLSDTAFRLYVTGLCYCSRNQTDGLIPKPMANRLVNKGGERLAFDLIKEQLWEDKGDSYYIPDYLEHQRSRSEIEALREAKREAGASGGKASGRSRRLSKQRSETPSETNPETETYTETEADTSKPPPSPSSKTAEEEETDL